MPAFDNKEDALALDYTSGPAFLGLAFDSAQIAGTAVGLPEPAMAG